MPYTFDHDAPYQSGSGTSYRAAIYVGPKRGDKTKQYLALLSKLGPLTDHEAAVKLNLPIQSVNSIRSGVMRPKRMWVQKMLLERIGPYGKSCSTWYLTAAGRQAVKA